MSKEKERLLRLIKDQLEKKEKENPEEEAPKVYAEEYRKQTGKDLETGEYVIQ